MAHAKTKELKDLHWSKIKQQETEVKPRGVQCIKHVRVYVSAQEGVWFGPCRITYTYNKHI